VYADTEVETPIVNGPSTLTLKAADTTVLALGAGLAVFTGAPVPVSTNAIDLGVGTTAEWRNGYFAGTVSMGALTTDLISGDSNIEINGAGVLIVDTASNMQFQATATQQFDFHDGAASPTDIRIFNDYNGATSNEWIEIGWKETKANGTGDPNTDLFITAGGHLEMGSSPGYQVYVSVSGTRTWRFRAGGQLEPQTASTVDLGSPTNTVRRGYFDELRSPTDVDIVLNPQGTGTVTSTTDINGASPTEMSYLSGASSNIQAQLDALDAEAGRALEQSIPFTVGLGGKTNAEFHLVGEQEEQATGQTGDYTTDFGPGNQHIAILVNSITTGGDIVITGTSVTESGGLVTTGDTETITVDTTAGQLYQTDKKWLEITNIDVTTGTIVGINYDIQHLGYLDGANTNFTIEGFRADVLTNGALSDFAVIIEKVQDDGGKKCSVVTMEDYGHDSTVSGGAYFDNLRTGADDRSYTMGSNLAASDEMICYKTLDYSSYFSSDENVIEGAAKNEGIMIRFEGRTAAGAATNISSIENCNLTLYVTQQV
jgi:hypothetical protein